METSRAAASRRIRVRGVIPSQENLPSKSSDWGLGLVLKVSYTPWEQTSFGLNSGSRKRGPSAYSFKSKSKHQQVGCSPRGGVRKPTSNGRVGIFLAQKPAEWGQLTPLTDWPVFIDQQLTVSLSLLPFRHTLASDKRFLTNPKSKEDEMNQLICPDRND
ncbi:hypothetical protein ACOSQ2_017029 [Xanthoceras sorbifolium]